MTDHSAKNDYEEALDFLRDRLLGIATVRHASLVKTPRGLDIWVLVDEPYLENEVLVLTEIGEARRRFPRLFVDFLVLPSSAASAVRRGENATLLVSR